LAWYDEFEGSSLNSSLWTPANTNIPTNNSLQDYLPQQVTVASGKLIITSQNLPSRGLPYRSGLVTSTAIQKHGRWEVRAKLPTSTGMWPAIWLLPDAPWPSRGEIDIMENRGDEPTKTSSAFHYGTNPPYQHSFLFSEHTTVHHGQPINYHNGFHNYAAEWDPDQIRFYVDDVHFWTLRDSNVSGFLTNTVGPMRLIINTAIGGNFLQNPNQSTVWPQTLEVEYVRVFSRLGSGPDLTFENGGFEAGGGSMAKWSTFGNTINNVSTSQVYSTEGSSSLKLYGQFNGQTNYSGVEQGLSVSPGQELVASAQARIPSGDSIAGSSNRAELKVDYYRKKFGQYGTGDYIRSDLVVLADGNSPSNLWLTQQLTSVAPPEAVEARVALVFRQMGNAAGAVFVDNVQFSSVLNPATIVGTHVLHAGWTGSAFPQWDGLDTSKQLAKETSIQQTLNYSNLTNSSHGINGLVFEIDNLPGALSPSDFVFQMSPQGAFVPGENPPPTWANAPAPFSVTTLAGAPSRVVVQWENGSIINRWLRATVLANTATNLSAPEVYYLGHLLGETTGVDGDTYTVSFADITPIRAAIGQMVDASSHADIDKNATISFSDISAMRDNVGVQLRNITLPASE